MAGCVARTVGGAITNCVEIRKVVAAHATVGMTTGYTTRTNNALMLGSTLPSSSEAQSGPGRVDVLMPLLTTPVVLPLNAVGVIATAGTDCFQHRGVHPN